MTLAQAKALTHGTLVHYTGRRACAHTVGPRGGVKVYTVEARVSGNVQTWKRDATRIRVPVKHGLRESGSITEWNLDDWHLASECPALPSQTPTDA